MMDVSGHSFYVFPMYVTCEEPTSGIFNNELPTQLFPPNVCSGNILKMFFKCLVYQHLVNVCFRNVGKPNVGYQTFEKCLQYKRLEHDI